MQPDAQQLANQPPRTAWSWRRWARAAGSAGLLALDGGMGMDLPAAEVARPGPAGTTAAEIKLFNVTNVWHAHLFFTADQWEAMEPAGGFGPFGGRGGRGGGGPRPGGGPGGEFGPPDGGGETGGQPGFGPGPGGPAPGGPAPGGPGGFGFGPGMFLAGPIFGQADTDHDQAVTEKEFLALGDKWFAAWDTNHSGTLDAAKIRAGLNASLASPPGGPGFGGGGFGFGGAGFGGPRPGGPGRGGGGPPGMNLQGRQGGRNGLSAMMGVEFPTVRADLDFEGRRFDAVAVRYKGNGTFMESRGSLKRSLKVDLNDNDPGRALGGVTKLNFHNNVTDASWMNEVLSHRLFRDAGVPAPRTAFAEVYLTVPGEQDRTYLGLYSVVENVDNRFALDRFGSKKGAILKPVTRQPFEDLGDDWAAYQQTYDPKTTLSSEEKLRVIAFCKLVSHASDAEFNAQVGAYVDLDEFARFMAVTVWLSTLDSILGVGQNYLVHLHPRTHRFQFIPWDLDHSFGQFPMMGSQEQRENLSLNKPWDGEIRFLDRMFRHEPFKRLYLDYVRKFHTTIFRPERFVAQVDEVAAAIRPSVERESKEKLARFDQAVAGESPGAGGFFGGAGGGRFGPPGGFGPQTKPIKGFVVARAKSVEDQLAGRSEGMTPGRMGFGGPGDGGPGRGPGRGGGPGGPGGPGMFNLPPDFGPGLFLGGAFKDAFDADKDGQVTREEYAATFKKWFHDWDANGSKSLNEAELRAGLDKDLPLFRGGPPGGGFPFGGPFGGPGAGPGQGPGPGFGPPANPGPPEADAPEIEQE